MTGSPTRPDKDRRCCRAPDQGRHGDQDIVLIRSATDDPSALLLSLRNGNDERRLLTGHKFEADEFKLAASQKCCILYLWIHAAERNQLGSTVHCEVHRARNRLPRGYVFSEIKIEIGYVNNRNGKLRNGSGKRRPCSYDVLAANVARHVTGR